MHTTLTIQGKVNSQITQHIPLSNFFPSGSMSLTSNMSSNNTKAIVSFIFINAHQIPVHSYLLMRRCRGNGCSDKLIVDVRYTSEYCVIHKISAQCASFWPITCGMVPYTSPACAYITASTNSLVMCIRL